MDAAPSTLQPTAPKLGRRQYVVDRRFQYRYTVLLSMVGALTALAFGALMYLAHRDALVALAGDRALPESIARQSSTLIWLMVGITVLMAAALAMFGLLMTHRVAGPVHVLSHYVSVLGRGRYPIMRPLRKGDELQAFFERFETTVESLREREAEEADVLEGAVETLGPLCATEESQAIVAELREMARRKRDATDRIDLGADGQKSAA
jgi:hypothetical protein